MDKAMVSFVLTAIGTTDWRMNYHSFLERVEGRDDEYWKAKWNEWRDLAAAVARFDADTLYKIVRPEIEDAERKVLNLPPFAEK